MNNEKINEIKSLDQYFPKGDKRRGEALVLVAEAFLFGKYSAQHGKIIMTGCPGEMEELFGKEGLCESEVRKNLVLAEIGEPLTLPLATLNRSCKFKEEWNRIQKVWHKKKAICEVCGKEFPVSKGRSKYCSIECSEAKQKAYSQTPEVKAKKKAYRETPEVKAKQKAYYQTPEVKAKKKAYSQTPEVKAKQKAYSQTPEVKAKKKAYYQDNKEDILNKLQKRRATQSKPNGKRN